MSRGWSFALHEPATREVIPSVLAQHYPGEISECPGRLKVTKNAVGSRDLSVTEVAKRWVTSPD